MRRYFESVLLVLILLMAAAVAALADPTAVEPAAPAPAPLPLDPLGEDTATAGFVALIAKAVTTSNWYLLAALVLIGAVALVRRFGAAKWPWIASDRGSVALVFLLAALSSIAVTLAGGAALGAVTFVTALKVGLTAIGGFHGVKRLLFPKDTAAPAGIARITGPPRIIQ